MLSYCLKCKKKKKKKKKKNRKCRFKSVKKNGRAMLLSKCTVCSSKKSRFKKEQEAKVILSSLGLKTPLSKIPLFGNISF